MKLRVSLNSRSLALDFDRDYGIDHRTGWSIAVNGHYAVELEPHLIVAFFKSIRVCINKYVSIQCNNSRLS